MPISTVALNHSIYARDIKINTISTYLFFLLIFYIERLKICSYNLFYACFSGVFSITGYGTKTSVCFTRAATKFFTAVITLNKVRGSITYFGTIYAAFVIRCFKFFSTPFTFNDLRRVCQGSIGLDSIPSAFVATNRISISNTAGYAKRIIANRTNLFYCIKRFLTSAAAKPATLFTRHAFREIKCFRAVFAGKIFTGAFAYLRIVFHLFVSFWHDYDYIIVSIPTGIS